jgi:TolB protein
MCGISLPQGQSTPAGVLHDPRETRLRNVRQLTFGGENAEAYFSFDGKKLIFQSTRPPFTADQMFTMNIDGTDVRLGVHRQRGVAPAASGRPTARRYSTAPPTGTARSRRPPPDRSQGYVWGLFPYRLYLANADGSERVALTDDDAYNAEGSFHPRGDRVLFTTTRWGQHRPCGVEPAHQARSTPNH